MPVAAYGGNEGFPVTQDSCGSAVRTTRCNVAVVVGLQFPPAFIFTILPHGVLKEANELSGSASEQRLMRRLLIEHGHRMLEHSLPGLSYA